MLSKETVQQIFNQALDKYASNGMGSKMYDDTLSGTIPVWDDVDKYHYEQATCTIPGDVIKDRLYGDFNSVADKYLAALQQSDDYKDPLNPAMFNNTFDCFDYCMDLCKDIEDYFWDSLYPDIQQTYFEEHAELP